MKAKLIFINENEMRATGNQYALASQMCNEHFSEEYIRLDDVIDFIQCSQNASADAMIKAHEKAVGGDQMQEKPLMESFHAEWRTYNYILEMLKKYKTK